MEPRVEWERQLLNNNVGSILMGVKVEWGERWAGTTQTWDLKRPHGERGITVTFKAEGQCLKKPGTERDHGKFTIVQHVHLEHGGE